MSTQQEIAGLGHSNTPKLFRYVLRSSDYGSLVLPHVPEGWNNSELTFIRDSRYKGVLQSFSTNELKFVKKARDYIQTAYEKKGIDYDITITISIQDSNFAYQQYFVGKLDLSTYKIDSTGVTVKVIATGFQNAILNRDDLKVDLLNTKFIGGGEGSMAQISGVPTDLVVSAYSAIQNADWIVQVTNVLEVTGYTFHVPMNVNDSEFPAGVVNSQTLQSSPPFFVSDATRTITLTGNVNGTITTRDGLDQDLDMTIRVRKNDIVVAEYDIADTTNVLSFDLDISDVINLVSSDELDITGTAIGTNVDIFFDSSSVRVKQSLQSNLAELTVDGWPIFEFTARILQLISGEVSPLESEFLGRTDSSPTSYGSDGDGSLIVKTKGQWIREYPIEEGGVIIQTFNASLKELFDDVNARENIGLGFEVQSGVNKVVIERETYFFDISDNGDYPATDTRPYTTNQILDFSSTRVDGVSPVTDEIIEKEVLPDWYANEIESGYSKFEYEIIQGLKEFNTKSVYATPIKSIKKKLSLTSPFRYDTQGVNKLRSKPYSTDATEDVNGDNDVFGFEVKRVAGFTVKTDEDFDIVTGGVDPSQSYNINYTPRRNLERHDNRIRSMQFVPTDEVQFLETDKNSRLVTMKTGESATKAENGDILVDDLTRGYWFPEAFIVPASVNNATISAIQANPYGVIKLASDKYGWILEVQTNNQNNKGQFKLLKVDLDMVKIIT